MTFELELKKFGNKVEKEVVALLKTTSTEAFDRIVKRTPVDTGAARASWCIDINRAGEGEVKTTAERELSKLGSVKADDVIFIWNDMPYIRRLEHGWSKAQAPKGMVAITIAEMEGV